MPETQEAANGSGAGKKTRGTIAKNPTAVALNRILNMLAALQPDERVRVLKFVASEYADDVRAAQQGA